MSLLQEALRKAQQAPAPAAPAGGAPLAPRPVARGNRFPLRAAAAVGAALLLGGAVALFLARSAREAPLSTSSPSTPTPPPAAQAQAAPVAAATVSAQPASADAAGTPAPRIDSNPAGAGPSKPRPVAALQRAPAREPAPKVDKSPILARFNEGVAAQARGDWETAARIFREVVTRNPTVVEGWNQLGAALLRLGKPAEADAAIGRALSLDPDYPAALLNAGLLRLRDGRAAEAVPLFSRAAELDPRSLAPRVNLAISQARLGRLAESEETLLSARRAFPSNPEVLYHLGTVYERMGNRPKAAETYDAFLSASSGRRPDLEKSVRERLLEWGVK